MQMNLDASESYVNTLVVANCNLLSRAIQGDVQRFELIEKNSASCILGDVRRFTKSVNFTFLITFGNLSSAKMEFWLVAKQK